MSALWARGAFVLALGGTAVLPGCRPELDDDPSQIHGPRVLAVRAEPAEARPGETVRLVALTSGEPALGWSFCNTRRAPAEPGPIDPGCFGSGATPLGRGGDVRAALPREACRAFGPDRPLATKTAPAGRPADPDATGGFYVPGLATTSDGDGALFEVRVRCGLPGATQAVLAEFERRYRPNENPRIDALARVEGGPELALPVEPLAVRAGGSLELRIRWPSCDGEAPCEGAEPYIVFDAEGRTLVERREAMTASWLATAGTFDAARTGRSESDRDTSLTNRWRAPAGAGSAALFVVLRDSRGGVSFRSVVVKVE